MAIDPRIILGAQGPQLESRTNALAGILQLQGAMNQNRAFQAQQEAQARALERQNQLQSILAAGGGDKELLAGGFLKEAGDLTKTRGDAAESESKTRERNLNMATRRIEVMGSSMRYVMDNPTVDNARFSIGQLAQAGILDDAKAADILRQFEANPTPEGIRNFAEQGFRASLQSKDQLLKSDTRNTGATTDTVGVDPVTGQTRVLSSVQNTQSPDAILQANTSRANNAATVGATIRGQNLVRDAALQGGTVQTDNRGNVVLVPNRFVPGKPVTATPVTGPDGQPLQGAPKAGNQPTEDERKAAGYVVRMEDALNKVREVTARNPGAAAPNVAQKIVGGVSGTAENYMSSSERQIVKDSQLDALDAALTLATGAAYTKLQLESLRDSYFPQPGDSKENIAAKNDRFQKVIETARIRAGRAAGSIAPVMNAPTGGTLGAIKFLGFE